MTWTQDELDSIGEAQELEIAPRRPDGTHRRYVPIWVVRAGSGLYVRSGLGAHGKWYQAAVDAGTGRIRAGGVEAEVRFEQVTDEAEAAISTGYRTKYRNYGEHLLGPLTGPESVATTLKLVRAE